MDPTAGVARGVGRDVAALHLETGGVGGADATALTIRAGVTGDRRVPDRERRAGALEIDSTAVVGCGVVGEDHAVEHQVGAAGHDAAAACSGVAVGDDEVGDGHEIGRVEVEDARRGVAGDGEVGDSGALDVDVVGDVELSCPQA